MPQSQTKVTTTQCHRQSHNQGPKQADTLHTKRHQHQLRHRPPMAAAAAAALALWRAVIFAARILIYSLSSTPSATPPVSPAASSSPSLSLSAGTSPRGM